MRIFAMLVVFAADTIFADSRNIVRCRVFVAAKFAFHRSIATAAAANFGKRALTFV